MSIVCKNMAAATCAGMISAADPLESLGGEAVADRWRDSVVSVDTVTRALRDPVGLAVDHASGTLYVAEPQAGRITVVVGRSVVGAFHAAFTVENPLAAGATAAVMRSRWNYPRLRSPMDVALDGQGRLFVAESVPGARILMFDLKRSGFARATVVACCPPNQARVFSSIDFDEAPRLCAISYEIGAIKPDPRVETYAAQAGGTWSRETSMSWTDYPFASRRVRAAAAAAVPRGGTAALTASGVRAEPAVEWLYAQPSFTRMAVDQVTGDVYATMRRLGTVVKVRGGEL